MTLAVLLILLVLAGVALAMFPVEPTLKKLIIFVLIVAVVLWLAAALGVFGPEYGYVDWNRRR